MRPAFTLIELLVVIAIISALATLTIPSISIIKERSRGSQCISNLTQFSAGIAKYATDWNGRIPGLFALTAAGGSTELINHAFFDNYMGVDYTQIRDQTKPFLKCPALFRLAAEIKSTIPTIADERRYRANAGLNQFAVSAGADLMVSITMLNPQAATLFCASASFGTDQGCEGDGWVRNPQFVHRPSKPPYVSSANPNWPHWYSGKTNVLHIDGHISTLAAGPVDAGNPWGLGVVSITNGSGQTDYDDSKYVPLTNSIVSGQPSGLTSQSGKDNFNAFWMGQLR